MNLKIKNNKLQSNSKKKWSKLNKNMKHKLLHLKPDVIQKH